MNPGPSKTVVHLLEDPAFYHLILDVSMDEVLHPHVHIHVYKVLT